MYKIQHTVDQFKTIESIEMTVANNENDDGPEVVVNP